MRVLLTYIFLGIFCFKIFICLATIRINSFDSNTIYSVIMQLEIESEQNGAEDAKENFNKDIKCTKQDFSHQTFLSKKDDVKNYLQDNHQDFPIKSLYTEIITPPPERN